MDMNAAHAGAALYAVAVGLWLQALWRPSRFAITIAWAVFGVAMLIVTALLVVRGVDAGRMRREAKGRNTREQALEVFADEEVGIGEARDEDVFVALADEVEVQVVAVADGDEIR